MTIAHTDNHGNNILMFEIYCESPMFYHKVHLLTIFPHSIRTEMAKPDAGDADARERTAEVPIATTVSSVLAVHVTYGGRKREQTARTVRANRITGRADQVQKNS